jgi:hypothetical protein
MMGSQLPVTKYDPTNPAINIDKPMGIRRKIMISRTGNDHIPISRILNELLLS